MNSRVGSVAHLLVVDLLGSVVWFPAWWYTKGIAGMAQKAVRAVQYRVQAYAFVIWIKNFFVPMYGQYDWTGRLISVFMRAVVIIGRFIALVAEILVYAAGLLLWLLLPVIAILLLLTNLAVGVR